MRHAYTTTLTGGSRLSGWPAGMRVIGEGAPASGCTVAVHRSRRGCTLPAFVTNTRRGQLPDLSAAAPPPGRCQDRIRAAKATGLQNLPLHGFDQNRIWLAIVQLACEFVAWTQMLAFTGHAARCWEPKRLRLRLWSIAGRITRHAPPHCGQPRCPSTLGEGPHRSAGPTRRPAHTGLTSRNVSDRTKGRCRVRGRGPRRHPTVSGDRPRPHTESTVATLNPKMLRPARAPHEKLRLGVKSREVVYDVVA